MRTTQIIPVEELSKAALLFEAVGRWAQVDPFVLPGLPQALDEDVVVAAPASIHADLDPVIPQHLGELVAGELRALIGIEDAGLAEPGERLAQRLDTEPCRQRVRQPPGQHPSGCPVDDRDQVQKPLLHRYVRYVSCPYLVRLVDRLAAQKIWIDLVLGMPLAGVPFRPDRPQPELLHQPPDPPAANRNPLTQQRHLEPAAAVDRMVCENPVEPLQKLEFVNAGEKLHQRAGVKLHQDGMPKAPTGGLLLGDKQDEKRNCLTRDVTKSSSHSLTQPAPIASLLSLEPKLLFLLIQCELLDVVGPVELWATRWRRPSAAANPQGFGWPATPPLTHFVARVMLIRLTINSFQGSRNPSSTKVSSRSRRMAPNRSSAPSQPTRSSRLGRRLCVLTGRQDRVSLAALLEIGIRAQSPGVCSQSPCSADRLTVCRCL